MFQGFRAFFVKFLSTEIFFDVAFPQLLLEGGKKMPTLFVLGLFGKEILCFEADCGQEVYMTAEGPCRLVKMVGLDGLVVV